MPPKEIEKFSADFWIHDLHILPFALPCSLFMIQDNRYQDTLTFKIENSIFVPFPTSRNTSQLKAKSNFQCILKSFPKASSILYWRAFSLPALSITCTSHATFPLPIAATCLSFSLQSSKGLLLGKRHVIS